MKKAISILLLFSLTFQCFSELTTVIGFEIYKDYIAETLCVNKDHPEMDCEGSCYLHHQMQEHKDHKDTNGMVKELVNIPLFCTTEQSVGWVQTILKGEEYPPFKNVVYSSPLISIDRPPRI